MEEKFYYSKKTVRRELISRIVMAALPAMLLWTNLTKISPISVWIDIILILLLLIGLFSLAKFVWLFKIKNTPTVIVTETRVINRPLSFHKYEVDFKQIISATVSDVGKRIDIDFKIQETKQRTGFFSIINLRQIGHYEKLVEVLKQRIKFV